MMSAFESTSEDIAEDAARQATADGGARTRIHLQLLDSRVSVALHGEAQRSVFSELFDPCPPHGHIERADGRNDHADAPALSLGIHPPASKSKTPHPKFRYTSDPVGALDSGLPQNACSATALSRALVQWAVDRSTTHCVFHAASVARDGLGVLCPAPTGNGKSTLAVALGQRGFELLSDELGAIELDSGRLVGFPRAVTLRENSLPLLGLPGSIGVAADRRGGRIARPETLGLMRAASAQLALVLLPEFRPSSPTRIDALRPAEAATALLGFSCSQHRLRSTGFALVMDLAEQVPVFRLRFSRLNDAVDAISDLFSRHSRSGTNGRATRPSAPIDGYPCVTGPLMCRTVEDRLFVYDCDRNEVAQLNASAAAILERCDGRTTARQIAARIADLYGDEAGEVSGGVARAIAQLEEMGLLVVRARPCGPDGRHRFDFGRR